MATSVFQAFEYASYNIKNEGREGKKLPEDLYESLKSFAGEKELQYYSLTANGVRFQNYVGALQIGKWIIEVLPKFDRIISTGSAQPILIQMLKQAGILQTKTPTESSLRIKRNYILEAYIQMFLDETKGIAYKGLIKKYHKLEENSTALKGSLNFGKQISKNLIHAEKFYVKHTIYDQQHELNQILYKTLKVISGLNVSFSLHSEANTLLIDFPEMQDLTVTDELFGKLRWHRKTEHYKKAISIARLLLLNFHPDLSHGKNNVLALMFDMNALWEKWFTKRLKAEAAEAGISIRVHAQTKKTFWIPDSGHPVKQKPDIVIEFDNGENIILDTKWKLVNSRPSEDDLRQMYTYNQLFDSRRSYLVYPGDNQSISGQFFSREYNGECGLAFVPFLEDGKLSSVGIERFMHFLLNNTAKFHL